MQIERAEFEFVDKDLLPDATMRIRIIGQEMDLRAVPIVAEVGSQAVDFIVPLLDGSGVQGFLADEPAVNDALRIGYADGPLIETGITYNPVIS